MRTVACLIAIVCAGCQTAPVVSPKVDVAAFRTQNTQTKGHIGKVKVSQGTASQHLERAENDLDELLKE
jgi:hypothetical protein